jgi:hypothetical protein
MKATILKGFDGHYQDFYGKYLKGGLKQLGGDGYQGLCPFHDDKNPSLSINAKNGTYYCHGCGGKGDAFTFFGKLHGFDTKSAFGNILRRIADDFGIPWQQEKRKLVKTYDYTDASGQLLYQVCRFEPKDFRQRRPDGNGGWIWDLKGIETVLYRLPDVIKANEVIICEGEKDANNLRACGFCATTAPMGAGKWREEYNQWLNEKNIVFLPDNDDPGREHMAKVAASLNGNAASLKLLQLPGLPNKGDVSDFISKCKDIDDAAERLSILIDQAAKWAPTAADEQSREETKPPPDTTPRFQFIHNAEIMADLRPIEWRIRDILTDYSLYYNFGDPGHFKTFIELDRLLCIASGIDYHGHKVKQGTVFYIAGEGQQGIGRRIAAWHIAHGTKPEEVPFFVSKTPTQLMELDAIMEVRQAVDMMTQKYGPPAVVHIDTLARNFGEGDENATKDMNTAISNLDRAFGTDFCRGLTHHTGHGNKDRARGSMALHGAADGAFRVSLTDSGLIAVECKKLKDAPNPPLMVFERREVPLQIGDTEDRSYVLELTAEGDEATAVYKPKAQAKLKAGLAKAVGILRNLQERFQENLRKNGRPSATPQILYTDWRDACKDAGLYKRTDHFRRAVESILLTGIVGVDESQRFVYLKEIISENGE